MSYNKSESEICTFPVYLLVNFIFEIIDTDIPFRRSATGLSVNKMSRYEW